MPRGRLFYGGMKRGVELSFLGLFELFLPTCGNEQSSEVNGSSGRIRRFLPLCLMRRKLSLPG
ncbi:MAG: hypothetical protein DME88_05285 [Verrucomicrobia bacterium]|nr:MAG: hypothetical protein DME88_05285 [Verrucomicrobiota bacterium]